MAHSFVDFQDQYIRLHDSDLSVAVLFWIESGERWMRENESDSKLVSCQFSEWFERVSGSGPGCIDLELDRFLANEKSISLNLRFIDMATHRIESFGSHIPKSVLVDLSQLQGVFEGDYPSSLVLTALNAIKKVIVDSAG
jgi:hypothetical protein